MDKLIDLEIVSPVSFVYQGKVKSVSAPGTNGGFQVLYNHAPFVSSLTIGKVKIVDENGNEKLYSISSGILEVSNNKASIIAESIEVTDEIDIERAKKSLERAIERMKSDDKGIDKDRARLSYERAKNRIKFSGKEIYFAFWCL